LWDGNSDTKSPPPLTAPSDFPTMLAVVDVNPATFLAIIIGAAVLSTLVFPILGLRLRPRGGIEPGTIATERPASELPASAS